MTNSQLVKRLELEEVRKNGKKGNSKKVESNKPDTGSSGIGSQKKKDVDPTNRKSPPPVKRNLRNRF